MKILLINGGPKKSGATAKIIELLESHLSEQHKVNAICLGEKNINFCLGCKKCHVDGECCQSDDCLQIVKSIYNMDAVILVAPSYWADVPGQLKVFIDRCTPYSNTNQNKKEMPHNVLGYAIALRTGTNPAECEGIIKSLNHYYGHMEIEAKGGIYFCGVEGKDDIEKQEDVINSICEKWFGE
jgi:multimeric flavodoxin WrbA